MAAMDCDVLVVGAGLAGLRAAVGLTDRHTEVLEARGEIGGRVRTEVVDGFRCDVGFQLVNPCYPRLRADVDLEALGLQPFVAGVRARTEHGDVTVADPRRHPRLVPDTLRSGFVHPVELARIGRWVAPVLVAPQRMLRSPDQAWGEALDRLGATGAVRHRLLVRFLAGVLLEDDGSSSAHLVRLLLRSFALGTPSLPREGVQALPRQLADRLPRPVRCSEPVTSITRAGSGWRVTTEAATWTARAVVVATDTADAGGLLPDLPPAPMKGVTTWWYAVAAEEVAGLALPDALRVDGRERRGPLVNAAVVSAAAPSYAPPGRALLQGSALLGPGQRVTDEAARRHLEELLQLAPGRAELLVRHDVDRGLPAQPPPLHVRQPQQLAPGLFVCGDHRDTGSQQGALASGARVAELVRAQTA